MGELLGEVKMFVGTIPPRSWAFCDGSLLPISSYNALFTIIGTQFGGDGETNFALPDFRGCVPIGAGSGSGLTPRMQGDSGGLEKTQLTVNEIPSHSHTVACDMKTAGRDLSASSENNVPGQITQGEGFGSDLSDETFMNQDMITDTGGGNPFDNMQPWKAINFIICIVGVFPTTN
ncbi:MAG: phage tail protein [Bacteroidales bacterium]|nr:phage tail protein [Bacteroidales bacterium]